jgi:hypothetical protein
LVMVVQLPKLLWIHPQFTSHLYVRMRQVKLASRLDPGLQVCRYLCDPKVWQRSQPVCRAFDI